MHAGKVPVAMHGAHHSPPNAEIFIKTKLKYIITLRNARKKSKKIIDYKKKTIGIHT
jgi:hypothetical protein